jgi:hypothetical protein
LHLIGSFTPVPLFVSLANPSPHRHSEAADEGGVDAVARLPWTDMHAAVSALRTRDSLHALGEDDLGTWW